MLVETMADTPAGFKAEALIFILPDNSVEEEADINEDILLAAIAAEVVDRMDHRLP